MAETVDERRQRHARWWGDAFTPACKCGCGEPVPIGIRGPMQFANVQHRYWHYRTPGYRYGNAVAGWAEGTPGFIPIGKFRAVIKEYKTKKGMSLAQVAEKGGWSIGMMNYYMYSSRVVNVGEDIGKDFLRRLAGMGAPMSTYQRRRAKEIREAEVVAESQIRNSHKLRKR